MKQYEQVASWLASTSSGREASLIVTFFHPTADRSTSTVHDLSTEAVDLLVVGAGVVGLAHAAAARLRGLRVAVIERDERAVGASVRNFGHLVVTPQTGRALDYAMVARERWLSLGRSAGVPVQESGTLVLARTDDEMGVLEELSALRGIDQVVLLDAAEIDQRLATHDTAVLGGAHLPLDLRTDPRVAVARLADWLQNQGVRIHWRTAALGVDNGLVITSRGVIAADRIVVCVGHDVDQLAPSIADSIGLRRCALQMMRITAPSALRVEPAVLSGLSMLRYDALAATTAARAVRAAYEASAPELLDVGMNLMFTQRADGDLIVGDTHDYAVTHDPFDDESVADLVLRETARLLGVGTLTVRERWRGVYASAPDTDFLVHAVDDRTRVVSVTTGIGMTTCHGLAEDVLDQLL